MAVAGAAAAAPRIGLSSTPRDAPRRHQGLSENNGTAEALAEAYYGMSRREAAEAASRRWGCGGKAEDGAPDDAHDDVDAEAERQAWGAGLAFFGPRGRAGGRRRRAPRRRRGAVDDPGRDAAVDDPDRAPRRLRDAAATPPRPRRDAAATPPRPRRDPAATVETQVRTTTSTSSRTRLSLAPTPSS